MTQTPEVRVSPGGELAQRWGPEEPWQFQGGTHDGEVAEDSEVEDWTTLVPEAEARAKVRLFDDWLTELHQDDGKGYCLADEVPLPCMTMAELPRIRRAAEGRLT